MNAIIGIQSTIYSQSKKCPFSTLKLIQSTGPQSLFQFSVINNSNKLRFKWSDKSASLNWNDVNVYTWLNEIVYKFDDSTIYSIESILTLLFKEQITNSKAEKWQRTFGNDSIFSILLLQICYFSLIPPFDDVFKVVALSNVKFLFRTKIFTQLRNFVEDLCDLTELKTAYDSDNLSSFVSKRVEHTMATFIDIYRSRMPGYGIKLYLFLLYKTFLYKYFIFYQ